MYCRNCGKTVESGQAVCLSCGYALSKNPVKQQNGNKISKTIVLLIMILIVVIGVGILIYRALNPVPIIDFQQIYNVYCNPMWAKVGSDGSYLSIDTNPTDGVNRYYSNAWYAIEDVNEALGLPVALSDEMEHTYYDEGTQVRTYDELGIRITWRYHPDTGLEVTYSKL